MIAAIVVDNIEWENYDTVYDLKMDSLSFKIPKQDDIGYDKISTGL